LLVDSGEGQALARALGQSLVRLARDPAERTRIGAANRARARAEYDEARMIERYRALYWGLMAKYPRA
jgi:glycosyltransferase involved in cell wall biosynthesis